MNLQNKFDKIITNKKDDIISVEDTIFCNNIDNEYSFKVNNFLQTFCFVINNKDKFSEIVYERIINENFILSTLKDFNYGIINITHKYFVGKYNIKIDYNKLIYNLIKENDYDLLIDWNNVLNYSNKIIKSDKVINEIIIQLQGKSFNQLSFEQFIDKNCRKIKYEFKDNKLKLLDFCYIYKNNKYYPPKSSGNYYKFYYDEDKFENLFNVISYIENNNINEIYNKCPFGFKKREKYLYNSEYYQTELFSDYEIENCIVKHFKLYKNGNLELTFIDNETLKRFINFYIIEN